METKNDKLKKEIHVTPNSIKSKNEGKIQKSHTASQNTHKHQNKWKLRRKNTKIVILMGLTLNGN